MGIGIDREGDRNPITSILGNGQKPPNPQFWGNRAVEGNDEVEDV